MFCLTVAESAVAGTPSVTTRAAALQERVDDGRTGFLIPGSIDDDETKRQFVDRAVAVLDNERLRDELGEAARDKAHEWSVKVVARAWEDLAS